MGGHYSNEITYGSPSDPDHRRPGHQHRGHLAVASATAAVLLGAGVGFAAVTLAGRDAPAPTVESQGPTAATAPAAATPAVTAPPATQAPDPVAQAAPPMLTMDCTPRVDDRGYGRVRFDYTYRSDTDAFTVRVDYGDGRNFTSTNTPGSVDAAFWHDYEYAGDYGPVTAKITDANGRTDTVTCRSVHVPDGRQGMSDAERAIIAQQEGEWPEGDGGWAPLEDPQWSGDPDAQVPEGEPPVDSTLEDPPWVTDPDGFCAEEYPGTHFDPSTNSCARTEE